MGFPIFIRCTNGPKVGVVPIALHRVAAITKGLKVFEVITSAKVARVDVVDL
jgi:hypothetical protein